MANIRLILIALLLVSFNANAYGEKEHQVILDIFHECQKKHYENYECQATMESNIDIKIPPFVLCNLLNECGK